MAVEVTVNSTAVRMDLNNGTDTSGNIKTVGVSIGKLSHSRYNDARALAIADDLSACLSKTLYKVTRTQTAELRDDG